MRSLPADNAYSAPVALTLSPGEQVIFQGHPSWRAILGFYIQVARRHGGDRGDRRAGHARDRRRGQLPLVGGVIVAGIALTILGGLLKRITTTYTITNRRLNIKRGLISREVQETRLERVQNVNFDQSVYQRVMQIGDVDFDTAAGDDYNFIFAGVAEPGGRGPPGQRGDSIGAHHAGLGDDEPAREGPSG